MDVLEMLKPICATDADREKISTPFRIEYEGKRWAAATNGHMLVATHFDGDLRTDGPNAAAVIPAAAPTHTARVAELRKWAGAPVMLACDECKGSGEIKHDCNCSLCEYFGSSPCEDCNGTGKVKKVRHGYFLDGALDRDLLFRVLATTDAAEVFASHAEEMGAFFFRADGWLALIMPIRPGSDTAKTRFSGATAIPEKPSSLTPAPPPEGDRE